MSRLHDAADRYLGRFRGVLARAVTTGRRAVKLSQLEAATRAGDRQALERGLYGPVLKMESELAEELPKVYQSVLAAGGDVAGHEIRRAPRSLLKALKQTPEVGMKFDRNHPSGKTWAQLHAGELVTEVTEETRAAIRATVTEALTEGIPPRQTAVLLRDTIGLTRTQAGALMKLRRALETGAGKRITAGSKQIRVPPKGLTADQIEKQVSAYADRLLKARALTIARTETMAAVNEGQRQMWQQAVTKGRLSKESEREWVATPDEKACPICAGLDGTRAPLRGSFEGGLVGPPAHPRCRCTTGLVPPRATRTVPLTQEESV